MTQIRSVAGMSLALTKQFVEGRPQRVAPKPPAREPLPMNAPDFAGKVAFVTGGAIGIGAERARAPPNGPRIASASISWHPAGWIRP